MTIEGTAHIQRYRYITVSLKSVKIIKSRLPNSEQSYFILLLVFRFNLNVFLTATGLLLSSLDKDTDVLKLIKN